jgi:hypothetical protein
MDLWNPEYTRARQLCILRSRVAAQAGMKDSNSEKPPRSHTMASRNSGKKSQSSSRSSSGSSNRRGNDFPLDNNTYNVITVIHEKSKGLEAFDEYLQDADEELRSILEQIREQDTRAIEQLQEHLRMLIGGEGAESEDEEAA